MRGRRAVCRYACGGVTHTAVLCPVRDRDLYRGGAGPAPPSRAAADGGDGAGRGRGGGGSGGGEGRDDLSHADTTLTGSFQSRVARMWPSPGYRATLRFNIRAVSRPECRPAPPTAPMNRPPPHCTAHRSAQRHLQSLHAVLSRCASPWRSPSVLSSLASLRRPRIALRAQRNPDSNSAQSSSALQCTAWCYPTPRDCRSTSPAPCRSQSVSVPTCEGPVRCLLRDPDQGE